MIVGSVKPSPIFSFPFSLSVFHPCFIRGSFCFSLTLPALPASLPPGLGRSHECNGPEGVCGWGRGRVTLPRSTPPTSTHLAEWFHSHKSLIHKVVVSWPVLLRHVATGSYSHFPAPAQREPMHSGTLRTTTTRTDTAGSCWASDATPANVPEINRQSVACSGVPPARGLPGTLTRAGPLFGEQVTVCPPRGGQTVDSVSPIYIAIV
jgi:hypothetical protein